MLEHEGPPDVDGGLDDFRAEPRVGLLGLSGVEDEGGRCRMPEPFAPALCNKTVRLHLSHMKGYSLCYAILYMLAPIL